MKLPPLRSDRPLYCRLLRLNHLHPNSWQRAALGEGAIVVGAVLVMADLASLWVIPALPVAVAVVVKGNDMLAGVIAPPQSAATPAATAAAPATAPVTEAVADVAVEADQPEVDQPEVGEPEVDEAEVHEPVAEEPVVEEPVVVPEYVDPFKDESAVRVIPPRSRRSAAARPGAAAARAQAAARRPRPKSSD
jgi:hypothetical protein